jgi:hypothetical protein
MPGLWHGQKSDVFELEADIASTNNHLYHFPQVRVTLLGWCKVKVDWNWGLGEMWKGVLECRTGRRVRIFGIDTKNLACWAGCK